MRVLLADDEPKVRSALRLLLEQLPKMTVVGEAAESLALLAQMPAARPDLVLLDWELPGWPAKELLMALRNVAPDVSVMALSGHPEARHAALKAGANAFVSKGDPPEAVLEALCCFGDGCQE